MSPLARTGQLLAAILVFASSICQSQITGIGQAAQITEYPIPESEYGLLDQKYWIERQAEFYRNTTFELSLEQMRLLKGEAKYSLRRQAHLPFWFDYKLFKTVFGKNYSDPAEELERHLIYIKTCLRTLKARVLFRILAATRDYNITKDADLFFEERVSGQKPNGARNSNEISFNVSLSPAGQNVQRQPDPLAVAMRLVLDELARVESRNQLNWYLKELDGEHGSVIGGKLPYIP